MNIYADASCLLVAFRLQDQAEHEGMLQLGQCRVGTHNAFLVTVKLVIQLSRSRNITIHTHFALYCVVSYLFR